MNLFADCFCGRNGSEAFSLNGKKRLKVQSASYTPNVFTYLFFLYIFCFVNYIVNYFFKLAVISHYGSLVHWSNIVDIQTRRECSVNCYIIP